MDLWIVAAATGAGYVAKHWKTLSKEKDDSLEYSFSSGDDKKFKNLIRRVRDRTEPYALLEDGRFSGHQWFDVSNSDPTASSSASQSATQLYNGSSCRMQWIYNDGVNMMMHEKENTSFEEFNGNRQHRIMSKQPWSPLESSCLVEYSSGLPNLQGALSGVMFILGLTIGVISGIVTYRDEIDRLNDAVNQTQILVHDLHEQLEMKEQIMNVEETSSNESFLRNIETVMSCADDGWDPEKSDNIDAELEVELKRLELNFRITDYIEVDSDFEIDIVRGDVKLDEPDAFSDSDEVTGTIETLDNQTPSPNYAVSPQELALRLHQVLQEQLEARIWELEASLEAATQKKLDSA